MTKQEQIEEILEVIKHCGDYTNRDCAECDYRLYGQCHNQKQCEAEALYNEGYRKIDEFEKCRKCPAWSGTDCTRNPYTEGCLDDKVNLKNEIKRLEKENKQLKTECSLLDDELRIARQDTIDVLNELKTKAFDKDAFNGWAGPTFVVLVRDIDKMIKEYEYGKQI